MDDSTLENFNPEFIANLALETFMKLSGDLQELLLQSKNEQSFSGLLSLQLQMKMLSQGSFTLLELKGVNYQKLDASTKSLRSTRNFHDIAIVNSEARFQVIIENKVWYHFDGAKGKTKKKIEKGVVEQISGDINKIRITLASNKSLERGFILIHLVTPNDPKSIPKSYLDSHRSAIARTASDLNLYRNDGLDGVKNAVKTFERQLLSVAHTGTTTMVGSGKSAFLDVICAEVKI